MPVICVVAAAWGLPGVEAGVAHVLEAGAVPRVAVEAGRFWADAGGIRLDEALELLCVTLREHGIEPRCGVADTPIAAWAAATTADRPVVRVPGGGDRAFLSSLPLDVLEPDVQLRTLLEGVGIETCGALAAIPSEAIEVRFGGEAVEVWQLARADDRRRLFHPIPAEQPHATIDFIDYVVTSPGQLLFTANALLGNLCAGLAERGEHARAIELSLPLANGDRWSRVLRSARPTANRAVWLRLTRSVLERLTVPDAVAGMAFRVQATETASAVQGDLFDAGFATSVAVEAALARLLETLGSVIARPASADHPLPERGLTFDAVELETLSQPLDTGVGADLVPAGLTLQLLSEPRAILVESFRRRDHVLPVRYRDGHWKQLTTVAGPDRLSGGAWERSYAREYFRGVTTEGTLVLLFRDAQEDAWYLHGWWD